MIQQIKNVIAGAMGATWPWSTTDVLKDMVHQLEMERSVYAQRAAHNRHLIESLKQQVAEDEGEAKYIADILKNWKHIKRK